jgi:hypothetical protein
MINFILQETTINFDGDIMMNHEIRKYNKESKFTIIRQTKGGLYVLEDIDGIQITLPKRNIEFFKEITKFKSIEELGKAYGLSDDKIEDIKKIHKLQQDFIVEEGDGIPEAFDKILFPLIRRCGINGKIIKDE